MSDEVAIRADLAMIKRMIPHRYPFLLVDKVVDMVANSRATGIKNVTVNEPYFVGHFPGMPVFPGVYSLESMAQTAAILVNYSLDLIDVPLNIYLMRVDNARFRRQVVPGDMLELHMTVIRGHGKVWKLDGNAIVDGNSVAEATITAYWEKRIDSH